ncbi:hypothetical protein V2J09_001035 [Rumex salicifolius]
MTKPVKIPYQLLPTQNTPIQLSSSASTSPEAANAPVTDPPIADSGDEESLPSLKSPRPPKQIALIPLIALIYFEVAGGPYGEEAAVGAAGPLFAILGFLIFPFIWSIPEALITAELATTFPGNGGFVIWAHKAFGPFWGSMMGSWKFLSGVINLASYPALCIEYLKLVIPSLSSGILTCLAYLLPLLAAIGAIPLDQKSWVDGYFADDAEIIVGKWLKIFMEVGAVLSIIGLFEAQLSSCAYQFLGMADLGFLPRSFGERSKRCHWRGAECSEGLWLKRRPHDEARSQLRSPTAFKQRPVESP